MNVIISNKYQALLATLDTDIIKNINGVFGVDEIVAQFSNFFFNKMILDVTAIKDYENIRNIQELSLNIDMSKVILLLDDSVAVNSQSYISQLVSMGIYNFTKTVDSVKFLIENPNTYKDVANFQSLTPEKVDNAPKFNPFNSKSAEPKTEVPNYVGQRIVGVKNITEHAGATTLVYLMKKHLEKAYNVKTVEINSNDFQYFNDRTLESISSDKLDSFVVTHSDAEIILVDLNGFETQKCTDVINLIEPGLIKLNKLIRQDNKIFDKLKDEKIILNKSILNGKDVNDFEKESGSKIFYNIPSIDDKLEKDAVIISLLISLGFTRLNENNDKNGIFGIF